MMARKVMQGASGVSILSPNNDAWLLRYTMDDRSGSTVNDATPNGRNIIESNVTFSAGIDGDAAVYNGTNAIMSRSPTGLLLAQGAMSFWAPANAAASGLVNWIGGVDTGGSTNTNWFHIGIIDTGAVQVLTNDGITNNIRSSSVPTTPTNFNHYVVQAGSGTVELWINGVESAITLISGEEAKFHAWFSNVAATNFGLGAVDLVATVFGTGKSDHLSLANRKLTPTEIATLAAEF